MRFGRTDKHIPNLTHHLFRRHEYDTTFLRKGQTSEQEEKKVSYFHFRG